MKKNPLIKCACGCGQELRKYSKYGRERKYINTHYVRTVTEPLAVKFWSNLKQNEKGCWIWGGAKNDKGYGQIRHKNKLYYTHRLSYEFHVGKIPKGMVLLHSCDNPACANPFHLIPGKQCENVHDAMSKKRMIGNPVSDDSVVKIRKMYGENLYTQKELGEIFNTHPSNISYIVTNKTRRDVNGADLR